MKKAPLSYLLPRLQDIFFASLFAAVLLLGRRMINLDGDLPRHLLTGRYILQQRTVPTTELFVYPYLERPNLSHSSEWLADVVFYSVYLHAGLTGLVVLAATLISSTFTILFSCLSSRLALRIPLLFLIGWGVVASSLNWAIRPHLISMLFLAVWLLWAEKLSRGEEISLWVFPIGMLIWSNLHGEFIAGILVLLAFSAGWVVDYWLDRAAGSLKVGKRLWQALLLSAGASLINPGGIGPWFGILGFVNNPYLMSRMLEANPPDFQSPQMRVLLGLIACSVFLLSIKKESFSAGHGFLLAGFSAMALIAVRNIHLYGVVAPFVLAWTLTGTKKIRILARVEATLQDIESRLKGQLWPPMIAIALGGFVMVSGKAQAFYQFGQKSFPVQAVHWLEQNPQKGRMFNDLNWGGYLELGLWPEQLTFVDSMADVSGELSMQYESVITLAPGWHTVFERYNIAWVIVEHESPLVPVLENDYRWGRVYEDGTAIVLRK